MANEVRLLLGAATDVGTVRTVNEDAHGFARCGLGDLLVVCDGMGGHAAGDLASRTARDAVLATALTSRAVDERALLHEAILAGHLAVRAIADASPDRAGMGTTIVAALIRNDWAWIANVGDSRCYLVRDGRADQLSLDHTKGQRLLDSGVITATQLLTHPEKGVLTQALGQRNDPEPAISEAVHLQLGDAIVLCSDGVYESMHEQMAGVGAAQNPNYAAHDLVVRAVELDGKDNATAVVARYVDLAVAAVAPSVAARGGVASVLPVAKSSMLGRLTWPVALAVVCAVLGLGLVVGRVSAPRVEVAPATATSKPSEKAGNVGRKVVAPVVEPQPIEPPESEAAPVETTPPLPEAPAPAAAPATKPASHPKPQGQKHHAADEKSAKPNAKSTGAEPKMPDREAPTGVVKPPAPDASSAPPQDAGSAGGGKD